MTRSEAFSSEVTDKLFEVLDVSKLGIQPYYMFGRKECFKTNGHFEEEEFRCHKMELVDFFIFFPSGLTKWSVSREI